MQLQTIEWKKEFRPEGTDELYVRGHEIEFQSDCIKLKKEDSLDFNTYSNGFNWKKWKNYTHISNLRLVLRMMGTFLIEIDADGESVHRSQVSVCDLWEYEIPVKYNSSLLTFRVTAVEPGLFFGGSWNTDPSPESLRDIKIALVICTFNRDEYLFRNLDLLSLHMPSSYGVFVIDNGNRIPTESIDKYGDRFRLYRNNNTGGSGGFTRGLTEALRDEESWTHVLFMDDDITIERESLLRTLSFMKLLKEHYHKHFLSGSMLRMDQPWIVHESTATWDGVKIRGHKKGLDLRVPEQVNLMDDDVNDPNLYAAWWFCLVPLYPEMSEDLPFPFFIYGDDMEYSLRRATGIIRLNGVCVWHEPFEKKYSALMKGYFLSRNMLILNTLRSERFSRFHLLGRSVLNFLVPLFVHDYVSVSFVLEGIEDYLKGPEYVQFLNNQAILKEKGSRAAKLEPVGTFNDRDYHKIKLNEKKYKAPFYFLKRKIAAYDYEMTGAELRMRSVLKVFRLTGSFLKLSLSLLVSYGKLKKAYGSSRLDTSFWDGINKPFEAESHVYSDHLVNQVSGNPGPERS